MLSEKGEYIFLWTQTYKINRFLSLLMFFTREFVFFSNNLLRWCILRVIQQCDKHLDKVLNVEEFVRRIYTVIHSNDSVARALTIRFVCLTGKENHLIAELVHFYTSLLAENVDSSCCLCVNFRRKNIPTCGKLGVKIHFCL